MEVFSYSGVECSLTWSVLAQSGGSDDLHLLGTESYIYDGQINYDPLVAKFEGGQHVRVELTNMNILGVQLDVQDQSLYHIEDGFLWKRKDYSGDKHSLVLLPGQTRHFDFYRFDYTPMLWQFEVATGISDAANVRVRVYSNWKPGMPTDRPNYKR